MGYLTSEDLERRVGASALVQFADDDGDAVADAAVVGEILAGAEGEVDGFLARRYQVPIDLGAYPEVSGLLKSLALDIAEYRLRLRRPPVAEDIRRRYGHTVEWLGRLASGVVQLPIHSTIGANLAHGIIGTVRGEDRLMTRGELAGH
jgi:phage gp36-like protein